MYTKYKVSCGKNKQIFKTSESKCHGEFPLFLNTVCLGTSSRRGLQLLLLPSRANVARTVNRGTRSHPNCSVGGLKGWLSWSTSLKILRTVWGNWYSSLESRWAEMRAGTKLGIKRFFSCLECGKGQQLVGEQRGPWCYLEGSGGRSVRPADLRKLACRGCRKSWPYWC